MLLKATIEHESQKIFAQLHFSSTESPKSLESELKRIIAKQAMDHHKQEMGKENSSTKFQEKKFMLQYLEERTNEWKNLDAFQNWINHLENSADSNRVVFCTFRTNIQSANMMSVQAARIDDQWNLNPFNEMHYVSNLGSLGILGNESMHSTNQHKQTNQDKRYRQNIRDVYDKQDRTTSLVDVNSQYIQNNDLIARPWDSIDNSSDPLNKSWDFNLHDSRIHTNNYNIHNIKALDRYNSNNSDINSNGFNKQYSSFQMQQSFKPWSSSHEFNNQDVNDSNLDVTPSIFEQFRNIYNNPKQYNSPSQSFQHAHDFIPLEKKNHINKQDEHQYWTPTKRKGTSSREASLEDTFIPGSLLQKDLQRQRETLIQTSARGSNATLTSLLDYIPKYSEDLMKILHKQESLTNLATSLRIRKHTSKNDSVQSSASEVQLSSSKILPTSTPNPTDNLSTSSHFDNLKWLLDHHRRRKEERRQSILKMALIVDTKSNMEKSNSKQQMEETTKFFDDSLPTIESKTDENSNRRYSSEQLNSIYSDVTPLDRKFQSIQLANDARNHNEWIQSKLETWTQQSQNQLKQPIQNQNIGQNRITKLLVPDRISETKLHLNNEQVSTLEIEKGGHSPFKNIYHDNKVQNKDGSTNDQFNKDRLKDSSDLNLYHRNTSLPHSHDEQYPVKISEYHSTMDISDIHPEGSIHADASSSLINPPVTTSSTEIHKMLPEPYINDSLSIRPKFVSSPHQTPAQRVIQSLDQLIHQEGTESAFQPLYNSYYDYYYDHHATTVNTFKHAKSKPTLRNRKEKYGQHYETFSSQRRRLKMPWSPRTPFEEYTEEGVYIQSEAPHSIENSNSNGEMHENFQLRTSRPYHSVLED